MARPGKLRELEQQFGPLEKVIPAEVNRRGSIKAAAAYLGISESTVSTWLRDNEYILKLICEKAN